MKKKLKADMDYNIWYVRTIQNNDIEYDMLLIWLVSNSSLAKLFNVSQLHVFPLMYFDIVNKIVDSTIVWQIKRNICK